MHSHAAVEKSGNKPTPQDAYAALSNAVDCDLLTRTSWTDARLALHQIKKGKASGNKAALWLRTKLQWHLFHLGRFVQRHAGKVLFVGLLVLSTFCVGLKSASIQTDVEKLWVEEGGRLEKELAYMRRTLGEGAGSTHQILIQTPSNGQGGSLLSRDALLAHLRAVHAATKVTVEMFDTTWRLKDLCYSPSFPSFDIQYIDQIFENIFPCAIITPLDCFWEGSKLLGPDFPVTVPMLGSGIRWTNLHPQRLLESMKSFNFNFPFDTLDDFMKRAGITSAYQEKPCLDPTDPECPLSAPNKNLTQSPDIGAELTGGCYGFATKFMHWPEDLVVGGTKKNKTGHIVKAEALQSILQLMGEKDMYEYWSQTYRVHNLEWSQEKAADILHAWQRKFTQEVLRHAASFNETKNYKIHPFSSASLANIMTEFSELSIVRVAVGYILMLIYAGVSLVNWANPVRSQSGLGIAGVLLVAITVAAGLGFCALIGIVFNASTTQIVPFLALGLGVDNMFLLTHTYAQSWDQQYRRYGDHTGEILKRSGVSILLSSVSNACAFFAAAIIPIPALRAFSLQAGILVLFNLATLLLVFPAIMSLDMKRRVANRVDLLCCLAGKAPVTISSTVQPGNVEDGEADPALDPLIHGVAPTPTVECQTWTLSKFARHSYGRLLLKTPVKVLGMVAFIVLLAASVWGMSKVKNGLDLTDIVPHQTSEYSFLAAHDKYFGFYNMYAVTQGNFEYPNNQRLLYEYHDAFTRVSTIIKNDDGGLPEFWLSLFRDWLIGLQRAFDRDQASGCINQERWFANASDDAILAYKLLVQTGHVDNPIDKSLVGQVRLVDGDGIINPKAFYNYLTAWVTNDALAYSASQTSLRPQPRQWYHNAGDVELKIPKSQPIIYAQLPFYLNNLGSTEDITDMIEQVRGICKKFEDRGLPNFPAGIPFTFWEQYLKLRFFLFLALACVLVAIFLVLCVSLMSIWAATVAVFVLAAMVLELFGVMGLLGIKLSAAPAVILIMAVGVGVDFTIHILVGFVTSIGARNRRTQMSLELMMAPVVHGAISTLLSIVMLAFSDFDFIVKYFFYVLSALVLLGLVNGLFFLPILLSIVGPPAEVIPANGEDRIATPTPMPSPCMERCSRRGGDSSGAGFRSQSESGINGNNNNNNNNNPSVTYVPRRLRGSDLSLTTITEEPPSWTSSHEIVVQPEVVVETTTGSDCNSSSSSSSSSSGGSSPPMSVTTTHGRQHFTTKVTATAKVKVEVHAPISHSSMEPSYYKHRRRRDGGQ
ncbi:putative hedgehog receptor patched [Daphnia sinensis]|uniref:Hedgehog receptor patched n=1 Tax=Daphnia sinensis TaxID=1820382 RepID=A0AAD5KEQ1_9CRUS|nr:putative hedgehog receptor patched [Daphnia sinensis]